MNTVMKQFLLIFLPTQGLGLILEAINTNSLIISFTVDHASIFSLHVLFIFGTVCLTQ